MLLTRETDYALRIVRSLMTGEQKNVGDISKEQIIPQQFAYKISKKLANAGIIQISRGVEGGCRLAADLEKTSLLELMSAVEASCDVNACMEPGFVCPWAEQNGGCRIHSRLSDIQSHLENELRSCSLISLLKE